MSKFEKRITVIFAAIVMVVLLSMAAVNIKKFVESGNNVRENYAALGNADYKTMLLEIESEFKENLFGRKTIVNYFGLYQKLLNKSTVGNTEFIKDEAGKLYQVTDKMSFNTGEFAKDVISLKAICDSKDIPLLYVETPDRAVLTADESIKEFSSLEAVVDEITDDLSANDIKVLDFDTEILDASAKGELGFDIRDVYFNTDRHLTTDAEIWCANKVADTLKTEFGVEFSNQDYLFDMSLYEKKTYKMLGNFARTNGEKYVEADDFVIYHPKTETSYSVDIAFADPSHIEGNFDSVMTMGYEADAAKVASPYTYWVIDFMRFSMPYYWYTNNNSDGPSILVIADSTAFRSITYMTLCCKSVTVLDPRYFGGNDFLSLALSDREYDAVIVWQGTALTNNELVFGN